MSSSIRLCTLSSLRPALLVPVQAVALAVHFVIQRQVAVVQMLPAAYAAAAAATRRAAVADMPVGVVLVAVLLMPAVCCLFYSSPL